MKKILLFLLLLITPVYASEKAILQSSDGNAISASNPLQVTVVGGGVTPTSSYINADKVFNVKSTTYGAVGNGVMHYDGAITSGSPDFTSATGTFTSADVGKVINVSRAGASGGSLATTIAAYVSAGAVTLTANAGTTVTDASYGYGTDDTTAVQAAITAVGVAGGGTVFFPEGIYIINGAFQNASAENAQLVLPSIDFAAPTQQIKLQGSYSALFAAFYGAAPAGYQNNKGSILFFTKLGASGTNNVGIYNTTGAWGGLGSNKFSNILVEIENLNFRTGTNPGPSMLNLNNAIAADLKNVVIEVNERPSNLILQTISTSTALITPGRYNHVLNTYDGIWISGFYNGMQINEHLDYKNGGIYFCNEGILVDQMSSGSRAHLAHIKQISMESVKNYIFWINGNSNIQIDYLAIEEGGSPFTGTDFFDSNNYGYGTINYNIENGTGQATVTGGTNMYFKQSTVGFTTTIGGNVGIGTSLLPQSKLVVGGNTAIGASYVSTIAPSNGLIVQGNVGLGSTAPGASLDVAGSIRSVAGGVVNVGACWCTTPPKVLGNCTGVIGTCTACNYNGSGC